MSSYNLKTGFCSISFLNYGAELYLDFVFSITFADKTGAFVSYDLTYFFTLQATEAMETAELIKQLFILPCSIFSFYSSNQNWQIFGHVRLFHRELLPWLFLFHFSRSEDAFSWSLHWINCRVVSQLWWLQNPTCLFSWTKILLSFEACSSKQEALFQSLETVVNIYMEMFLPSRVSSRLS